MWHFFPGQYMPSYQLNRALSQAHYGGGEIAECLEAASEITPGDRDSFHNAWAKIGNKIYHEAEIANKKGFTATARRAYLRSFNYLRTAEFFLPLGDSRKLPFYTKCVKAFRQAIPLMENPPQQVKVPYEDSFLPGYLFKPKTDKKVPLMVMFGGLDSLAEEMYFGPAQLLNERGVALLIIDGPGQGEALRLNHIHSRYDYNVAGTAAYEWTVENLADQIDIERIGIMAVSMGGYMAARCAAFEPRFKVCYVWGAVWSYFEVWDGRPDNHPLATIVQHIVGAKDMTEARKLLEGFTLENGVAEKISIPTFILHGEDDKQNFVSHAYRLYDALTCEKDMQIIPSGQRGSQHCQVDDFSTTYDMLDKVTEKLKE